MKRIKKIKRRVAALVMSFFLTLGLTTPAFNFTAKAEALEVANSACTVADMIFSYCASGGVAVMNETVIDEVYNVLGSSFGTLQTFVDNGLLTYSNGQYVDSGLSSSISSAIENISSIDIGALFAQTAEQNPAGVALTGAGSLAGIAGSVATVGTLPVVAGVAVSGYCGFQIGTIIANFLGLYDKNIGVGVAVNASDAILNDIADGSSVFVMVSKSSGRFTYYAAPAIFTYLDSEDMWIVGVNYNASTFYGRHILTQSNGDLIFSQSRIINPYAYYKFDNIPIGTTSLTWYGVNRSFNNKDELDTYMNNLRNGTEVYENNTVSPDLLGSNGNLKGNYDSNSGSYNVPDLVPKIDSETQSINPTGISKDGWKSYINNFKTNTNNGNPELNGDAFPDILNRIIIEQPTPSPDPDPDPDPEPDPDPNPNPDPETVPLPDVNPYPDTYPVADPNTVPVNKEQPQYTEKATENETDIVEGDPYTTPDLLDKFPFCIPRDILRAFKKLDSGSREAPHIQWRFHPNEMIDYTFDVDFSTWENVAVLLRLLELIAFIVLLGVATRNLILS